MGAPRKQSTPNLSKSKHFLPHDTHTYVCISGGNKCLFSGKFGVLCFLETPVLRFAHENNKLIKIVIFNTCVGKMIFKHQIFYIYFKMCLTFSTGCAGLTKKFSVTRIRKTNSCYYELIV